MSTYVIVGGVAGGASAAARLRRMDESANVIVLERGPYVSFANCGLPYYVGGVIQQRDALLVSTPEKLRAEFAIDVRTQSEVTSIDRQASEVEVHDLGNGQGSYRLAYDKLILSPGAKPLVPPVPGTDLPGVFSLRDIPDVDKITAYLEQHTPHSAIVVGGGFIGLEMAENLKHRGLSVTLVEMMDQVMLPLDFDMAAMLHRHLREQGVRLGLGDGLRRIEAVAGALQATLSSGKILNADLVILAVGVRPESDLAKAAGLDLGPRGHILVNEHMQTSDPNIYAVGDAVQVFNPIINAPTAVPLAGPANRQARIAADHIAGKVNASYQGTMGTSIVKVFDLTAACTGANSKTLDSQGIAFLTSITQSQDHVAYYPGATPQTIKLFYTPGEGKLLGAQVVGYNAVDRSVDALAVAIKAGMTVFDLEHLELAYAPPYGAAKDPVNIAGYVASNYLRGDSDLITWQELASIDPEKAGILDVRTDPEWELGHIPGAVHIENSQLRQRLNELSRDKTWVVYCKMGRRAYIMERMLRQHGFQVRNLTGGWDTYAVATEPQSNLDSAVSSDGNNGHGSAMAVGVAAGSAQGAEALASVPVAVEVAAELNAQGLQCPGPIMAVYKRMQDMADGQVLRVTATDPGFRRDIAAWAERTGNTLLDIGGDNGVIAARLRKGGVQPAATTLPSSALSNAKTMVVFSGDLDHALASFVIANGAASMGQKVTMFFTFWGLNILRRRDPQPVSKNLVERMFGWMLPRGVDKLKLSKLNMGGLGTTMMKAVMRSKHVDSLPALMRAAQENGVRMIACQMSMDIMGIKPEELIDGVEISGVATFISETDKANASLFI